MSLNRFNPFEKPLQDPVPSILVAKNLLGDAGVTLFKRTKRLERLIDERSHEHEEEKKITMSAREQLLKERRWLRAGEFLLNIPSGVNVPAREWLCADLPGGYGFTRVKCDELCGGSYADARISRQALKDFEIFDPQLREMLTGIDQASDGTVIAKVVDISELIIAKKKERRQVDYLSTQEVIEEMDRLGYRPATFKELLAYNQHYWKPEKDVEDLTEEESAELAGVREVFALGSTLLDANNVDVTPTLRYDVGVGRILDQVGARFLHWNNKCHFLFIRKEFSVG